MIRAARTTTLAAENPLECRHRKARRIISQAWLPQHSDEGDRRSSDVGKRVGNHDLRCEADDEAERDQRLRPVLRLHATLEWLVPRTQSIQCKTLRKMDQCGALGRASRPSTQWS